MSKHLIICEDPGLIAPLGTDTLVVQPEDYIENNAPQDLRKASQLRVINLCRDYEYLSKGYYCSLLAEARGQRCTPPVDAVISVNWKRLSQRAKPELNALLAKHHRASLGSEVAKTFIFFFGRAEDPTLEPISRRLFDLFRFPLLAVTLKHNGEQWIIDNFRATALDTLHQQKLEFFQQALALYTGRAWANRKRPAPQRFWLAVLHDPKETLPPSDRGALEALIRAGKRQRVAVELLTREDLPSLLEYDALFIRETTAIDHHTYRFAHKAETEGIPVIDDTRSIIRCSNKVFLNELLTARGIRVPAATVIDRQKARHIEKALQFPVILKIPDGSFSRGVVKADNLQEYRKHLTTFFKDSEILLIQEFLPSDYDWRVGVLGGEPLFVCQYYMAAGHWQIYNHAASKADNRTGGFRSFAVDEAPIDVVQSACKAARLIGDGLYGVDLKQREDGIYIIEVNDNPNIDRGVEDEKLGDRLYDRLIEHFARLVRS